MSESPLKDLKHRMAQKGHECAAMFGASQLGRLSGESATGHALNLDLFGSPQPGLGHSGNPPTCRRI